MNRTKTNKIFLGLRIFALLTGITGAVGLGWAVGALSSPDAGAVFEQIGYISLAISGFWCLITAAAILFFNDPFHPSVFITVDVIVGLFVAVGGVMIVLSPFADPNWIRCTESRSTSVCAESSEYRAVVWRLVAAVFCFLNAIIHLIAVISASKECHQRRKRPHVKYNDAEPQG